MGLKIMLLSDGKVLCEIPLSIQDWPKEKLEDELVAFEEEFDRFSKLFDALSHENRLRMMKRLLEDEDLSLSFMDFMRDLNLNPKIVWESARKLREGGLLEKSKDGQYRCPKMGEVSFLTVGLALMHLLQALEQEMEV